MEAVKNTVVRMWEFAGREAEVRTISTALAGGCSAVFLSGEVGVGKTRLAEEVLKRIDTRGSAVLRVSATRAAATLPLGALAPLLPYLEVPDAMLLPAARDALLRRHGSKRVILLVDDAHHLDVASAALIYQLTLTRRVTALVVVRLEERWPDALTAMGKGETAGRGQPARPARSDRLRLRDGRPAQGGPRRVEAHRAARRTALSRRPGRRADRGTDAGGFGWPATRWGTRPCSGRLPSASPPPSAGTC